MITSVPDQVSVTEVVKAIDADIATDHGIVSFEFQMALKAPPKMNRFVYDYNKGDFKGLRSSLRAANLSNLISADAADINNDWCCWKDVVLAAVADFIPKKKLKGTNPLPWINGSIINLINKKDSIRKKLKQRASSLLKEKFKTLRSEIKRRLRTCREAFFEDMESNLTSNPKRFWSVLKVKSKHKNVPETITMATSDNSTVKASTPNEVAELFNQYFASVFASDQGIPAPERENVQLQDSNPFLTDVSLSVSQVELILRNLDTSKATGPDELPARILKETADVIAPSLTELFNKSLWLGYLPEDWKLANIVPVFKKDNKEQAENYRPISLLSIVSKVMERCIFNTIRDDVFNLVSVCQHGFLAERSFVTQLVEVLDQIGAKLQLDQARLPPLPMIQRSSKRSHQSVMQNNFKRTYLT